MSQPSAPAPPPPPEWSPSAPTEGPLAGSGASAPFVPLMSPPPLAATPSRARKLVPVVIGLVILAAIGVAVKMTFLSSGEAPGEAKVDAAFTEIPGFTYTELPAEALEQAQSLIDSNEEAADAIGSLDIRQANQGGAPAGAVIIFGVDPEVMGEPFEEGFITGFESTAGDVGLTESTVAGTDVISVTMPLGSGKMFFDEADGLIFFVQGNYEDVADKLTRGLIKGNL